MSKSLNRRQFNQLSMAALGGVVAGAAAGCGGGDTATTPPAQPAPTGGSEAAGGGEETTDAGGEPAAAEHDVAFLMEEPHVCRGLNTCMNKGASGENACAGQGSCATAEAHTCHYENACKGQGGCGDYPGQNSCKGTGSCGVPLEDSSWEKARKAFEDAMKEAGKDVGAAPAKA